VGFLKGDRQSVRFVGDHHQMNVVRHQAIAEKRQRVQLHGLTQQIHIDHPLGIRVEDELPRVRALRDMMGYINSNYTS